MTTTPRPSRPGQNLWSGVLFGVGLIAFLDEALFHQILAWHHFYDLSTPAVGILSDGLFHALSWFATIAGLFLFADLRRQGALRLRRWIGGVLIGAGGFQLYDGIVQHKLLGIHEIRYVPELPAYDLVWNLTAGAMIIAGALLVHATRAASATRATA